MLSGPRGCVPLGRTWPSRWLPRGCIWSGLPLRRRTRQAGSPWGRRYRAADRRRGGLGPARLAATTIGGGKGRIAWHPCARPSRGGQAPLAQSAERLHGKEKVDSSILSGGSGRRSSVGKSARLIIGRSTVQVCPSLLLKLIRFLVATRYVAATVL